MSDSLAADTLSEPDEPAVAAWPAPAMTKTRCGSRPGSASSGTPSLSHVMEGAGWPVAAQGSTAEWPASTTRDVTESVTDGDTTGKPGGGGRPAGGTRVRVGGEMRDGGGELAPPILPAPPATPRSACPRREEAR